MNKQAHIELPLSDDREPLSVAAALFPRDLSVPAKVKPADVAQPKKVKKKKKEPGSSRGIETMFRSAYRAQLDLTALAATKANIMI